VNLEIRVGNAGNGTPVFMAPGAHPAFGRPFGAVYDSGRRLWMYPAFYPAAKKVLHDLDVMSKDFHVSFSDAASRHVKDLELVEQSVANRALPQGFEFITRPYDHQVLGLVHLWWLLRSALFYEPGLGKSKIAIDLVRLLRHVGRKSATLILGPLVTVKSWGREIDRHSDKTLKWVALHGEPEERDEIVKTLPEIKPDIILMTYDGVRSMSKAVVDGVGYETVICDESHLVKSWDSQRTIAAYEVAQKASRRVLMTGSPTQGDPRDTYGQYKILGDCFMPEDYRRFKQKFCEKPSPISHVVTGFKNLDVLNGRVTFLSLHRTKKDCLDLPPQTIIDVEYDMTRQQKVIHNQIVEEMEINPDLLAVFLWGNQLTLPPASRMPHRAAALLKLLQVASGFLITNPIDDSFCDAVEPGGCQYLGACVENRVRPHTPRCKVDSTKLPDIVTEFDENPKLDAAIGILETVLADPSHKCIIWCVFSHELDMLSARLTKHKWGHVRVDGDNSADAQDVIDVFAADPLMRVYISQATTGVGVTINAATYMIFFSIPFSLTVYHQDIDRNYRIGQTEPVTVYRLIGNGTPERAITKLLDVKVDVDQALTHRMDCLLCPKNLECIDANVRPFDPDCVYKRSIARPVTRAHAFNEIEGPDPIDTGDLER
jgi:SNF2 family DNA or RNA helicase